ncbi:MAG: 4a-hydroxytetrahydrobiopterin dehydratase [Cyanobacteria bacterium P01_A01_bin.123]
MMASLTEQKCVPCEGGVDPMSESEIDAQKAQIPDWQIIKEGENARLQRKFTFPDFVQAMAFTQSVGEAAEANGHHPLICLTWGEATVTWWTHAIDGLHQNDFIMAAKTDALV